MFDHSYISNAETLPGNLRYLTADEEREIIDLEGVRSAAFVAYEFNLPIQRVHGIWNRSR